MENAFKVQQKLKDELGLEKVSVYTNPNYKAHGTKSYVYLMNRFGFKPTKPGPYFHTKRFKQRGLANSKVPIGGRVQMVNAFVKQTGPDETDVRDVTAEDQQNDSLYLCEVSIGSPPQKLKLDFDTGSSDLWVFSTEMQASLTKGHNVYDPSKSSTYKKLDNASWKIQYGDGSSASGDCGQDTVTIGGLSIKNQTVELAQQAADQFSSGTGDGLLGLGFPSINTVTINGSPDPQNTPVANMIDQGQVPKEAQLFTCALYSSRDDSKKSFYSFGFIDQDLVGSEDIHYAPIDKSQGFWMFESTTYTINGAQKSISGNKAIADTGTTLALLSDEVVDALYQSIPGATYNQQYQGYIFPLDTKLEDLPDFSVDIGGKEFVIQKEDIAFTQADKSNWYGGIQSRGENPFDILGDTFLKSVYAIWDQGNEKFGVVPKIEATQSLEPPPDTSGAS